MEMSKIIDVFTFNGEYDLLEIRLNILNDHVDEFIIVEARETFSGKPKPLYYEKEKARYEKWAHKIKYHIIELPYKEEYVALAHGSPNTQYGKGASHWVTEFCQKESIKDALTHLNDNDIVFVGDVDEIYSLEAIETTKFVLDTKPDSGIKLKLRVYSYYLDNLSSEGFWGTFVSRYKLIKSSCLNHLRSDQNNRNGIPVGWHFTSQGGYEQVKRKLSDSYTKESYWTPQVENYLEYNVKESKDFLGRNFTYQVDESNWPEYLKANKQKWIHLCR